MFAQGLGFRFRKEGALGRPIAYRLRFSVCVCAFFFFFLFGVGF